MAKIIRVGKPYTVSWRGGIARGVLITKVQYGMAIGTDPQGNTRSFAVDQHDFIQER